MLHVFILIVSIYGYQVGAPSAPLSLSACNAAAKNAVEVLKPYVPADGLRADCVETYN